MDAEYDLFARIVATGSLSAAGRGLHLSPAMVSKRLSRLEQRLGARLIHRTTRRLALTEVGQSFYEDVSAILAASAAAEARVAGVAMGPAGTLRISAPTSFGRLHVAPHLASFIADHPHVEIELDLNDAFVDLIGQRIDVAVRIAARIEGGLVSRRLADNRRILCAAPAYLAARGRPASLEDLSGHRLLAATHQTPWRLESADGLRNWPFDSAVRTNSSEVVRELAIAGHGIALRSTWDVARELRDGALQRVLPEWEGARDVAIFALHTHAALPPPHVRAFIAHLVSIYGDAPPWEAVD